MKHVVKDQETVTKTILKEELAKELAKLEDKVMTKLDHIVAELETAREDRTIGVYQTKELREEVDAHEKRIAKLEKKSSN